MGSSGEASEKEEEEISVRVAGIHGEELAELQLASDATILDAKVALSSKCKAPLHTQKLLLPGSDEVPEDAEELSKLKGRCKSMQFRIFLCLSVSIDTVSYLRYNYKDS